MIRIFKEYNFILITFAVFMASVLIRPALPIDETRYLGVAWEMWLKGDWIHLTNNYVPYHHKPPLLFWLMNIAWSIFGVSRWAAALVPVLSSIAVVFLTQKLSKKLFPDNKEITQRAQLLLLGSVPFLIYGSLIMFDMLTTVFVLGALLFLIEYIENRKISAAAGYGLCLGFGVLTKGPVIYIYALLPALLGVYWIKKQPKQLRQPSLIIGCAIAVVVSALPVLVWLAPLASADPQFLYWLIWKQSAGRVVGDFNAAHGRPLYFYVPILLLFFSPWILFPSFWRGIRKCKNEIRENNALRFLLIWIGGAFIVFSLISGKQPHYLVPLLPGLIILTASLMKDISQAVLKRTVYAMLALFIISHAVASKVYLPLYDWRPVAEYVAQYPEKDIAFVRSYHGEVGFYGRLQKPVTDTTLEDLPQWFKDHPDGLAIIRYKHPDLVKDYETLMSVEYRKKHRYAGVFKRKT